MAHARENGMNSFMNISMFPGQCNPQMNQLQSPKDRCTFPVNNLFQQQMQMPPPKIDQPMPFFPLHTMYDNKTMIQVAQQFNQYSHLLQDTMQSPAKKKSMFHSNEDLFASQIFQTPSKIEDPKIKSLCELQRIAVKGCESATKVFKIHAKRPYFKKIDLLCDRLKQDLSVTDKAVININSHGLAWALKDFIFVFNRIINAWVIMRDYFYSTSDGMNCVRDAFDPKLSESFFEWQEATTKFTKCLMESCENLNLRDQSNGNRKNQNYKCNTKNIGESSIGGFQNLFDPLIDENSEHLQLNGGYLKSAVYKPVSSSSEGSSPPDTPSSAQDYESFKLLFNEMLPENGNVQRKGRPMPLYERGAESTTSVNCNGKTRSRTSLLNQFENLGDDFKDLGIIPLICDDEDDFDASKLFMASFFNMDAMKKVYGEAGTKKVIRLLDDVMKMPEAVSFVSPSEGRNFPNVPNLIYTDEALSLSQIISNIQDGKYKSTCDIFIALKMISEYAKALQTYYQQDKLKEEIIGGFVCGVESALARYA